MLDALRELAASDVDEDLGFTIESATHSGRDLLIRIVVKNLAQGQMRSTSILCRQPRAFRILAAEWLDGLDVFDQHVLLWPHCQQRVALFCRGRPLAPDAIVGALWVSHFQLVGDWIPFKAYINMGMCPPAGGSGSELSGILADGPRELVARYKSVVESHGLDCSLVPGLEPHWWDGEKWLPEVERLRVLVIGGSYVVSPEFSEVRAEPGVGADLR